MTTRNESEPSAESGRKRGRPRVWKDEAEKQRGHRALRRERARLLDELLHAVRNAHWEEPEMHAVMLQGEEVPILQALIAYYRARYWMHRQNRNRAPAGPEK